MVTKYNVREEIMLKNKRKVVNTLLAVMLAVLMCPIIAFATEVGSGNGNDVIPWDEIVNAGYSKGDYNRDGKVTAYDARKVIQAAAGSIKATSGQDVQFSWMRKVMELDKESTDTKDFVESVKCVCL